MTSAMGYEEFSGGTLHPTLINEFITYNNFRRSHRILLILKSDGVFANHKFKIPCAFGTSLEKPSRRTFLTLR